MNNLERYQNLSKCLYELLGKQEFYFEDIEVLQKSILDGFREVIVICMDNSFDPEEFSKSLKKADEGNLEMLDAMEEYFRKSTDTDENYVIMNKFLLNSIITLDSVIRNEKHSEAVAIYEKYDIELDGIEDIESAWEKLQADHRIERDASKQKNP
jgi:hypothetical protein